MASPFYYSNRWNYPRRYYYPTEPSPTPSPPARKVVSIPVHHVASPSPSDLLLRRSDSAARKIQKVFRGFLVRKSMKRIAGIRSEVNAVEIRISGTTDLICRDGKERLKVNETLMSLLFRLDSVPGSDPGVRDFRKRVIKKAIALQEFVDSIADSGFENHESLESAAAIEAEGRGGDSVSDCAVQLEISREQTNDDDQAESQWEDLQNWTLVEEDDSDGCNASEKQWGDHSEKNGDGEKEKRKNTELLEKMAGENERMIGMMAALYERNRMQARLLDALSQRVEQLERAFICDKLRRKKRRSGIGSAADCLLEKSKIWKKL
ncbi:unnamed protein product [Linum tenue]|uniref:BAG domain-containing protein n=1 Tax=Linum tenue TaxID=586396 RepID=A0AAV0S2M3_9ROSI|nr:unnamed protein product [Linum tenue]